MTLTKQQILSKFGAKFATMSGTTPILQGVHYAADGSAVVTNRHYMLRIRDVHKFDQPLTLHAKTGQPLDGVYPDTSKILPQRFNSEFTILEQAVPDALRAAQCIAAVATKLKGKNAPVAKLDIEGRAAYLRVYHDTPRTIMEMQISDEAPKENSQRSLNAEYLATALAVFDAAGVSVTVRLLEPLHPIVLSSDIGIDVLILPVRV